MAVRLVQRGHQVTLVCISDRAMFRQREYDHEGVHFIETPDLLPGRMRSGWDPWDTAQRILTLRGREFDLIHAFETRPATIYPIKSLLARKRVPLVIDWIDWWGRGGLISEQRPWWYRILLGGMETYFEEHFRGMADSLTVISSGLAERAQGLGIPAHRIYKIRDGAEPAMFVPADRLSHRKQFGIPADRFVLAFSAADVTGGLKEALECLGELKPLHPQIMLIVTGNKPPRIDRMVRDMGLEAHFMHLGFLPYEALPKALSCADVFLLPFPDTPANRGRWPHKIADYMCMARPTVTNPVGEMKLLFDEEEIGLLAEPTASDLARKVRLLIEDDTRRTKLGARARAVAESTLSWDTVIDSLEHVYDDTRIRFLSGNAP